MSRIGATLSGMEQFFLTQLSRLDDATIASALRLTTGKQVNRPADDPAAFLQISALEHEWNVVQQTRQQVDVAAGIGAEVQLTLDQVRSQLDLIREALELDEDGDLTAEERTAQQATIDAAVEAINDLARTEIHGRRLLDGSNNYSFAGRDSSQVKKIQVFALRDNTLSGNVSSAATQAQVTHAGLAGALVAGDATFTLTGKRGAATISVTALESLGAAAERINAESHNTGIVAEVSGDDLVFTTVDYGESASIAIDVTSGSFNNAGSYQGTDAVVAINGKSISNSAVDGNRVSFYDNGTHVVLDLVAGFTGAIDPITVSDDNVSKFSLSTNLTDQTTLALPGVFAALLGGASGQLSDLASGGSLVGLDGNTSQALRVVDEALAGLTVVEGSVDAFADVTVASASSLLEGIDEELSETLNLINGVNEEEETLLLTKNQALGSNTIAAISVLQQQQSNTLALVRLLAGV